MALAGALRLPSLLLRVSPEGMAPGRGRSELGVPAGPASSRALPGCWKMPVRRNRSEPESGPGRVQPGTLATVRRAQAEGPQ